MEARHEELGSAGYSLVLICSYPLAANLSLSLNFYDKFAPLKTKGNSFSVLINFEPSFFNEETCIVDFFKKVILKLNRYQTLSGSDKFFDGLVDISLMSL